MKTLALALLLCASAVYAQQKFTFDPVVNSTKIDSLYITSGSKTVRALNKDAVFVTAGMAAQGLNIPLGTRVVSITSDSLIVLSQAATATDTLDSLQFAYPDGIFTVYTDLVVTVGSDTVTHAGGVIDSATIINNIVFGAGIPSGATVSEVSGDTLIVLSDTATASSAAATLTFYAASATGYSIGDAYGFAFKIPTWRTVYAVTIEDDNDVQDSVQVIFFDGPFTPTFDNKALSISDADAKKIMRSILVTDLSDLANNKVISWPTSSYHPLYMRSTSGDGIWVQLVAKGAATHTGVSPLRVTIFGE